MRHPMGKGRFKMSQFWTSFGQHLWGPEDMQETRFRELLCLKKWLVLTVGPIARLSVFLGYLLL